MRSGGAEVEGDAHARDPRGGGDGDGYKGATAPGATSTSGEHLSPTATLDEAGLAVWHIGHASVWPGLALGVRVMSRAPAGLVAARAIGGRFCYKL